MARGPAPILQALLLGAALLLAALSFPFLRSALLAPEEDEAPGLETAFPQPQEDPEPLPESAAILQRMRQDSVSLLSKEDTGRQAPTVTATGRRPSAGTGARTQRKTPLKPAASRRSMAQTRPPDPRRTDGTSSRTLMGVGAGRTVLGAGIHCLVGDVSPMPGVLLRTGSAYYDVPGRTPEEISGAMSKLVSAGAAGAHRAAGTARQEVRASFNLIEQGGVCRADEVQVELDVVITLPRLRDGVTLALQQRWRKFQDVIAAHENSHKAIAVRVANDLRQELDFAASRPGPCSEKSAAFTAAQQRAHGEMRRRQSEYDAYTSTHCGTTL
ncbi:MAG: DUF922 domain-containing protein [Elusimicrobiota bacterium]|mgnify:CR=1 FL=1